jgi:hypothetical protein
VKKLKHVKSEVFHVISGYGSGLYVRTHILKNNPYRSKDFQTILWQPVHLEVEWQELAPVNLEAMYSKQNGGVV